MKHVPDSPKRNVPLEYPEKTTDLPQVTDKVDHIMNVISSTPRTYDHYHDGESGELQFCTNQFYSDIF